MAIIGTGAGLLVLFVVFHWLGIFAKLRAALAFLGVCLAVGGIVGRVLAGAATWVANLSNKAAEVLFGISGGIALVSLVLLIIFIHDLHPKHSAGKRTAFVGIALAALLVTGASGLSAFNNVPSSVRSGIHNARTALNGG